LINQVAAPARVKQRLENLGWRLRQEQPSAYAANYIFFPVYVTDGKQVVHQIDTSAYYRLESQDRFMFLGVAMGTGTPTHKSIFQHAPVEDSLAMIGWWTNTFARNPEKPQAYADLNANFYQVCQHLRDLTS
jgi:hypothetical protein